MKICFIYKEDYPWDVRVEKIAKSFIKERHSVFLVCRNNERRLRREVCGQLYMRRLPFLPKIFGALNFLINMPFFFNPLWIYCIYACVKKDRCEAIIVRDLPLVLTSILIGKVFGIKVFYDMAECYPEMYRTMLKYGEGKISNFFLKNYFIASFIEYVCVYLVDHIFVMIEESRERLYQKGVKENKISIVPNTPELNKITIFQKKYEKGDVIKLLYVGRITRLRGIDNAIRGLNIYYSKYNTDKKIQFNIVGDGPHLNKIKELTKELGLENCVHFPGWCKGEDLQKYLIQSDIGILTHRDCPHWNTTIPNKLFDYMSSGLPVIATNVKPVKRIVEKVKCGMIFDDKDYNGFALSLNKLLDSDIERMRENGIKAIKEVYNWENDFKKILNIVVHD